MDEQGPFRDSEKWSQDKIAAYLKVLRDLKMYVGVSGGWAWHFMCPEAHTEYQRLHDHSCVDLMVPPRTASSSQDIIERLGFVRTSGILPRPYQDSTLDFTRYERPAKARHPLRLRVNFFVKDVPLLQCRGGWLVVRPDVLIDIYNPKSCVSHDAAKKLLAAGASPGSLINRRELLGRRTYTTKESPDGGAGEANGS